MFIGATSQYLFGALPQAQLEEMLKDPNVITSGVFADSGTVCFESRKGVPAIESMVIGAGAQGVVMRRGSRAVFMR